MAIKIDGNWNKGYAFDIHTIDSLYLGCDENGYKKFENTRSEMGELVYQLKYRNDLSSVNKIIQLIISKFRSFESIDYIVPVPFSKKRDMQPVYEIAKLLGAQFYLRVLDDLLFKDSEICLKDISNIEKKHEILRNSIRISSKYKNDIEGKNILLIDDIYDSGSTLEVATDILMKQGNVKIVNVLTMTTKK